MSRGHGRYYRYAFAACTEAEYEVVKQYARQDGLSISDFVRRCINNTLAELGDEVPLLEERADKIKHPKAGSRAARQERPE